MDRRAFLGVAAGTCTVALSGCLSAERHLEERITEEEEFSIDLEEGDVIQVHVSAERGMSGSVTITGENGEKILGKNVSSAVIERVTIEESGAYLVRVFPPDDGHIMVTIEDA